MNTQIAAFPSEALYENALISAESVKDRTLLSLPSIVDSSTEDAQDALSHPVVFFDTAGCEFFERSDADSEVGRSASLGDGSRSNANEAEVVTKWAKELVCALLHPLN
jgi:DNA polymerase alpha-associated DNA helicase A